MLEKLSTHTHSQTASVRKGLAAPPEFKGHVCPPHFLPLMSYRSLASADFASNASWFLALPSTFTATIISHLGTHLQWMLKWSFIHASYPLVYHLQGKRSINLETQVSSAWLLFFSSLRYVYFLWCCMKYTIIFSFDWHQLNIQLCQDRRLL